ncbi:MAG: DUF4276 family protein [Planctomycetaceae bacterium]|jgi:hypothetical protein|nr:DUF4276 family protein [Planctomycetaceae bacterium]
MSNFHSSLPFEKKTRGQHCRVHIICEGQTEEMFVNLILQPHFDKIQIQLFPKLIGFLGRQGGSVGYRRVMADVRYILANDPNSYVTTLIDFYGIYSNFPGVSEAKKLRSARERQQLVVRALSKKLLDDCGKKIAARVVPYVQMHEFEGLLFSSPKDMASGILHPNLWKKFAKISFHFDTPEDINDSIITAPSKRIQQIFGGYQKVLHGSIIAKRIGLETIRQMCPLFDEWLTQLENLNEATVP